jgi:hypothetical protein
LPAIIAVIAVLVIVGLIVTYWQIVSSIALIAVVAMVLPTVIRHIRKERYFASEEFLAHKGAIGSVVAEHNEVANYTSEIRNSGSFRLGASSTGAEAHLASFQNTSRRPHIWPMVERPRARCARTGQVS